LKPGLTKIGTVSFPQTSIPFIPKKQMDPPNADRRKKKDKAKEKFDRNGGHSQKHVRIAEALAAKKAGEKPKG